MYSDSERARAWLRKLLVGMDAGLLQLAIELACEPVTQHHIV